MSLFLLLLAIAVLGATAAAVAGRFDVTMSAATHTTPQIRLPKHPTAADIDAVEFTTALRGYRMDQVDRAVLTMRDEIERLRTELGSASPDPVNGEAPSADSPRPVGESPTAARFPAQRPESVPDDDASRG